MVEVIVGYISGNSQHENRVETIDPRAERKKVEKEIHERIFNEKKERALNQLNSMLRPIIVLSVQKCLHCLHKASRE